VPIPQPTSAHSSEDASAHSSEDASAHPSEDASAHPSEDASAHSSEDARTPAGERLSRRAVLEAGLRVADAAGLPALTMRRLAAELGVGAMTPYGYVTTKQELIDGIAALVLADLPPDESPGDPWQSRLERAVRGLREALRQHPGVAQIVASRRAPIPALDRFRENLLTILHDAGFPVGVAVQAVSALASYAAGFAAVEEQRCGVDRAVESARLAALPRGAFPRLSESAEAYAGHISPDAFTLGLRSFIAGLQDAASSLEPPTEE
jgi:TetR/AcrR family transcriptional regulator, tetracycline repressor protein